MRVRSHPGTALAAALALGGLLAVAPLPPAASLSPPAVAASRAPADTVRVTVYRVDAEAGTVDVLAGIGFALGVTRVHTVPETAVYVGEEPAGVGALRRGQIVEVRYWDDPEGYGEALPGPVARSIHVVPSAEAGADP